MKKKKMTLEGALNFLMPIIPIASIARHSGVPKETIITGKNNTMKNSKVYFFTEDNRTKLKAAITKIGEELSHTQINPRFNVADQILDLSVNFLCLKEFTVKYVGKSYPWIMQRTHHHVYKDRYGKERDYYNTFSPAHIDAINQAIKQVADLVNGIEIVDALDIDD